MPHLVDTLILMYNETVSLRTPTKTILSLLVLLLGLALLPANTFAAPPPEPTPWTPPLDRSAELSRIYCQRRNGSQLNLETWYGGRCNSTDPGETIGFGDIILLDFQEKLVGVPPDNTQMQQIIDFFNRLLSRETHTSAELLALLPKKSSNNVGLIDSVGRLMGEIYKNPPASSIEYLAYVSNNISHPQLVKPAYAQGFGFNSMIGILAIWKIFRNMVYLIFAFGFILYGFLIMFRIKTGQAVASIQTALPKLIFTFLAITFSYAIAGLMIDLFYVVTYGLFNLLATPGGIIGGSGSVARGAGGLAFGGLITSFTIAVITVVTTGAPLLIAGILSMPGWVGGVIYITGFFFGISEAITLILVIAVAITYIKIFWSLIKAYANICLSIIFSPLVLLGGILPGNNSFGGWVKGLAAELSTFTSTIILLIMAIYFLGGMFYGAARVGDLPSDFSNFWGPPPLVGSNLGFSKGKYAILGFGILLSIPTIGDAIRKAMKVSDWGFGSVIGQTLHQSSKFTNENVLPKDFYKKGVLGNIPGTSAPAQGVNELLQKILPHK